MPSLDGVCVTWEQGEEGHAALLLADRLECYNDFLNGLFAPGIRKMTHGAKELCRTLLSEGIAPGGFVFDTEVAAYLLAPADGSYDLEKLGMTYFNHQFPKADDYLADGAFGPLADLGTSAGAFLSHCALVAALEPVLTGRLKELGMWELYQTVELPLCSVLAQMELAGVLVDRKALSAFGETLAQGIAGD